MNHHSTTIVRHRGTRGLYALIGGGYAAWESRGQGPLGIDWGAKDGGKATAIMVCDRHGTIGAFPADELEVLSVDGVSPADALAEAVERFGDPE